MLYRMRIYQAVPENLAMFHDFFRRYPLPVQLRLPPLMTGTEEVFMTATVSPPPARL